MFLPRRTVGILAECHTDTSRLYKGLHTGQRGNAQTENAEEYDTASVRH